MDTGEVGTVGTRERVKTTGKKDVVQVEDWTTY